MGERVITAQGAGDLDPMMFEYGADNASQEIVAVLIPLDDRKADLLPLLVPRWDATDYGGRQVVYLLGCMDASPATVALFRSLTPRQTVQVLSTDEGRAGLKSVVWAYEHIDEQPGNGYHCNVIFLHKMAMLREAMRTAVVSDDFAAVVGAQPAWIDWLDQDIDAGPDSFLRRLAMLTGNTGPQRPRVACGLYCTRYEGEDIKSSTRLPLRPHTVFATDIAGFGCALMDFETAEAVSFAGYTKYRFNRSWNMELGREYGALGEDVYWFRQLEFWCGVRPFVDTDVRCRHYHADGTHWAYEEDGSDEIPILKARYHSETQLAHAAVKVINKGAVPALLDIYGLELAPCGGEALVSREVADKLCEYYPDAIEVVERREAATT